MPANLIPLVTNSGRIFASNKIAPESDGLVGVIDISERNKTNLPAEVVFNATGDSLLIADSRNQVTLLQICQNRFNVVQNGLRETPHSLLFTGRQNPQDQILIVLREQKKLQVYAPNGKLLESIQSNMHHQLEIKSAAACPRSGLLLTLSNDACVLWSTTAATTIRKERQLFAQNGCHFNEARFSPDGRHVGTLFRDGRVILWELDGISGLPNRQQDGQLLQFQFPSNNVKLFDFGQDQIVGGGPQFPFLAIKRGLENGQQSDFQLYKLPKEARGVEQLGFLTDRLLLGYISEGIFYLVDLGQQSSHKLQIALEIRLPGCTIKRFAVDNQMNTLALCATNGNVLLYNLPVAITNDQSLARKRAQMGIEKELIHTYLELIDSSSASNQLDSHRSGYIAVDDQLQQQHLQMQTGHLTSFSGGQGDIVGLLSQRQQPMQLASPLLNTVERVQLFNATEHQLSLQKQQQVRPLILPGGGTQQNAYAPMTADLLSIGHQSPDQFNRPLSQQILNAPMPMSALSVSDSGQNNMFQMEQQRAGPSIHMTSQQQHPMNNAPKSLQGGLHNITQSTVAGPYLTQTKPIVQLTMPANDRMSANTFSQQKPVSTQDALFQGIPTALMTQHIGVTAASAQDSTTSGQNFDHSIDLNFQPEFRETDHSVQQQSAIAQFNVPKLRRLLKQYGQLPDKYRTLTWKYLLKLPLNKEAFQGLMNRGVHPAFKDLHKRFPVSSYRLYNKLVRILSALGHWSPLFLDVQYLPQIVFPFLKVIPNDDLFVFELIMSLIVQWMQVWFEVYPSEPISVCDAVEQIVGSQDPRLVQHLHQLNFNARSYAWPFLTQLFTETLAKDDWLRLIDHLFLRSNEPELLLYFLSAFLISSKQQLMQVGCVEDLQIFLASPTPIAFKKIMTLAEQLHTKFKTSVFPGTIAQNLPVSTAQGSSYQTFTRYPDHFVTFQNRLRMKIVGQEEEIQKKNEILVDLKEKSNEILEQEQRMRLQQEAMARAEQERKMQVRTEIEDLLQERIRLDELQRKARLEHIQAVELAIKTSMTQQEKLREDEHRAVNEEVNAIQRQQKYEFESRMQDEMIANLELKANQKMLEQMQKQQQEEHSKRTKDKLELLQKETVQRQQDSVRRWEEQREETRRQNQMLNHQLKVQQEQLNSMREQDIIDEQFKKLKLEQQQMEQQVEKERQARIDERERLEYECQVREEANRQLLEDRDRLKREQDERDIAIKQEYAELDRLKQEELRDQERLKQMEELRQQEIIRAREKRTQNMLEDARVEEERQQIAAMKDQILQNRDKLSQKEQYASEGRDFMKMISTTAENVREIVKDGERQLAEEREIRHSTQSNKQQLSWVMQHPKYTQSEPQLVSDETRYRHQQQHNIEQQKLVESVVSERERVVREQNESLRDQLSKQYSQQMQHENEQLHGQENEGMKANQSAAAPNYTQSAAANPPSQQLSHQALHWQENPKIYQQMAQRYGGTNSSAKPLAYRSPSSTDASHFSDESSDVESYHQSKIKQAPTHAYMMTQQPQIQPPYQETQQQYQQSHSSNSSLAFPIQSSQSKMQPPPPQFIQTQLMPQNHQQLGRMPQSKSSIGDDISSSFVSSATESALDQSKPTLTYDDVSNTDTSMMTSQDSHVYQQMQQQIMQQHHQHQQNDYSSKQALLDPSVNLTTNAYHSSKSNLAERHQALTNMTQSQSSVVSSSLQASVL